MRFSIMLASECFPADRAHEGPFIRMGSDMIYESESASEALWAKIALENSWIFLGTR